MEKVIIIKATLEVDETANISEVAENIGVEIIPTNDDIKVKNIEIAE